MSFYRMLSGLLLGGALLSACTVQIAPDPVPTPVKHSLWGTVRLPGSASSASSSASSRVAQNAEVIPGEYLVKFVPGLQAQSSTLRVAGVTLERQPGGFAGFALYRAPNRTLSAQSSTDVLSALEARPEVAGAIPNLRLHAYATPNDPLHALQWDHNQMNLPGAWDVTTGKAVTVAVVDTGIVQHPDLVGNLLPGYDFVNDPENGGDGTARDPNPQDEGGDSGYHGSHVAGIVAARANNGLGIAGVSWGAKVVPVRVLGKSGGSLNDILSGTWWAAGGQVEGVPKNPNPAKVINLSLGGGSECVPELQELFNDIFASGVIVVAAAGNENADALTSFPANCDGIITVGAVGPDGKRAPYSNFGPRIDVMAPGGNLKLKLELGGKSYPGGVYSTIQDKDGDYAYAPYQGTSMAAPQVAGLVALLKGLEPNLTPAQIRARLKGTARPLGGVCDIAGGCGSGLVDALALLKGTGPTPTPVPTPPTSALKTLVFALNLRGGNPDDVDVDRSQFEEVQAQGLKSLFKVQGLEPGIYALVAWQDLNGDLEIDPGEPIGAYRQKVDLRSQDRGDLNIVLEPFEAQSIDSMGGNDSQKAAMRILLERTARVGEL